jgi:hypothetical protein
MEYTWEFNFHQAAQEMDILLHRWKFCNRTYKNPTLDPIPSHMTPFYVIKPYVL